MEKRPIVETLLAMKVGEKEDFPQEQADSIRAMLFQENNRLAPKLAEGWRYSVVTQFNPLRTVVTRTQ